ncbi:MAG: hypothetical protein FWG68_02705 [Defluviitaleaceae bacterium]|nr:hypothetical protein [Defluviitaleaceae bacterium]
MTLEKMRTADFLPDTSDLSDFNGFNKANNFINGLSIEEITAAFNVAVQENMIESRWKSAPIARYDEVAKLAYLEFADGSREYINE